MSQLMIDESTAVGVAATDAGDRRYGYLAGGLGVFVVWNLTTVLGFLVFSNAGDLITDLGLDVAGPAAFLALLWPRLADRRQLATAIAGAAIAVALVPVAPAGVPILVSMRRRRCRPARRTDGPGPARIRRRCRRERRVDRPGRARRWDVRASRRPVRSCSGPGGSRCGSQTLVDLLPAALLASLAIVSTVGDGRAVVDRRTARRPRRRRRGPVATGAVRRRDRAGVGRDGVRSRGRLTSDGSPTVHPGRLTIHPAPGATVSFRQDARVRAQVGDGTADERL